MLHRHKDTITVSCSLKDCMSASSYNPSCKQVNISCWPSKLIVTGCYSHIQSGVSIRVIFLPVLECLRCPTIHLKPSQALEAKHENIMYRCMNTLVFRWKKWAFLTPSLGTNAQRSGSASRKISTAETSTAATASRVKVADFLHQTANSRPVFTRTCTSLQLCPLFARGAGRYFL